MRQDGVLVSVRILSPSIKTTQLLPCNTCQIHGCVSSSKVKWIFHLIQMRVVQTLTNEDMRELATQFMSHIHPLLSLQDYEKKWMINMDQMSIFFSMMPCTIINAAGTFWNLQRYPAYYVAFLMWMVNSCRLYYHKGVSLENMTDEMPVVVCILFVLGSQYSLD